MSDPTTRFQRAQLLLQTHRIGEAEKELRSILNDDPEFVPAYALLALCLMESENGIKEAGELAGKAIALEPEFAFGHYVLAHVLFRQKKYDDADRAICKAIELESDDPDYLGFRGAMFLARNRRTEAKESLLKALAEDPDHHQSLTLLAQLESQLGNVAEAGRIAEQAVQNAPEDADAHVARGYSFVYAHRPKEAFEAFREALRLEPNSEYARTGLLQALQMHHFFYRGMFGFFAWMNRLSASLQWGLIIGLLIGYNILIGVMRANPEWTPFILPLIILYLLFAFMSWVSEPISFFLLLFSRWGRLAMKRRQKIAGMIFVVFLLGGIAGLAYTIQHERPLWLFGLSFGMLLTVIPLTCALRADEKKTQIVFGLYTLGMAALIAAAFIVVNPTLLTVAIWMLVGFQFLANYYSIRSAMPQ